MGTICDSAYGNSFMAEFEQKYIYPLIKDKSIFFFLTDDIFMYGINQVWKTVERFYEWIESKTSFYKDQQNKLQINLFRKSRNRQNLLNVKSEHPYSLKRTIPTTIPTAKHFKLYEYVQHSKTTTVTLEKLLNNLLIKDTKNMSW